MKILLDKMKDIYGRMVDIKLKRYILVPPNIFGNEWSPLVAHLDISKAR